MGDRLILLIRCIPDLVDNLDLCRYVKVIKQEANKGITYYYTLPLSTAGEKPTHHRHQHAPSSPGVDTSNSPDALAPGRGTTSAQSDDAYSSELEHAHRLQREQNDAAYRSSSDQYEQASGW